MKRLPRLLLTWVLLGLPVSAAWAVTVTETPGNCTNVTGVGTDNWNNPGNATAQGGGSATVNLGNNESSRYLRCTNYGFALPAGATVNGITVTVRRSVDNTTGNSRDSEVRLLKGGTLQPTNYAVGTTYPTTLTNALYGDNSDLWGTTWTAADINATNFGVSFTSQRSGGGGTRVVSVDVISVTVDYTPDTTAPIVVSIARADANPTSGVSSVSWTVTFSEAVNGVNAADFVLVQGAGLSGASLSSVTGTAPSTVWTVTANPGVATGTLGLNLVDDDSIQDPAGNRLGGTGVNNGNFAGEVYTVTQAPCNPPSNIPAGLSVSCICDNFNRSNLNPSPIFGQDWITTESDGSGVLPSIVNSNYLRLTDNSTYKAKAATAPAAFPAAGNYISVELLHYAYNGSGADGMVVTLSDYNVPAVPGAYGGSLGYAQQTTINGFAGGWIGVALDEYGNYQNPTEGRTGGPGLRQDSVAIRGSGSGTTGYRWLQGTAANLSPAIDVSGAARGPGYRYQIIVDARNAGAPTPQTFVTLNRDTTGVGNSYTALISSFDAFARAVTLGFTQAPVPANWQISLTASTGASTNIHEIGGLRICASTIVPPNGGVASGFAVIDEAYGTPPIAVQNYLTGRIYTKVAGTPFKLNVAAINNNQIQTGYVLASTKNVNVKLVDNSDGVCVLNSAQANYCSAACQAKTAVTGGSQTLTFTAANAGQRQSADFTVPGAWNNLVALVGDGTTINANGSWACSTDAFSVRPPAFTSLSTSASNSALTGTPALRAGTDTFTMTVGTSTSGYAGASAVPTLNNSTNPAFTPPRGVAMSANTNSWTLGTVSPGTFPAATASSSTGTFTYSEVGHFQLLGYNPASNSTSPRGIYDSTWTSVDQGVTGTDCISSNYANTRDTSGTFASNPNYGKYGCNFGITSNSALFGRFTPDHFVLVPTTSPAVVSPTITPACNGTTRNFTYMDQPSIRAAYRLEARNGLSTPARTVNYDATLYGSVALAVPSLVAEDTAYQGCDLSSRLTGLSNARWNAGVYDATVTAAAAAATTTVSALFSRPAAASASPITLNAATPVLCANTRDNAGNPFWALDIGVLAVDGAATTARFGTMNPGTSGDCTTTASCTAARLGSTSVVLGRLNLLNAFGSDAVLQVPVRAEYWNGSAWQLNTDDRCTTLNASALAVGNVTQQAGSPLAINSASVSLSPTATLVGGSTNFRIAPSTRGTGTAEVVLNLGFGVNAVPGDTDWCGAWNAGSPIANTGQNPVPNLNYLSAVWCNTVATRVAPSTRVHFGIPRAPYIYLRERY